MSMETTNRKTHEERPHAILFAYPFQGHIIPSVHLAINLASRGFTITFVNSEFIHHQTTKSNYNHNNNYSNHDGGDIFAAARDSGLDIRYATVSDGFPVEHDRFQKYVEEFMASFLHDQETHVEELVAKLVKCSVPKVTCLIADTFFVWASAIANKFGLVYVSFWTEPALVFSLYYHTELLTNNGHFASTDNRKDSIDYIPGVETIDPKDLTSYHQESDTSTLYYQLFSAAFNDAKGADFVLCNTVQELEPSVIAALQAYKPFYAIGPIFPPGFTNAIVATSLWSQSDCTQWLNSKPHGSVLYVSFGSIPHIAKTDLMEIANGLLLSNVSFVWVLRPDIVGPDDVDPLPVGFKEVIGDRGIVIPWCSQTQVLAHPAVGGFLTHCGWNSILEAIWCGVPFLCFPLIYDQFTNRKLLVDDWKVGINLIDGKIITKEEVSKNVSGLINGKLGYQLKTTMRGVKKKLEDALSPNGSSEKNMKCFIQDLNAKVKIIQCASTT